MDLSYKVEDFVQNFHASEVQPLFETLGFTKLTPRIVQVMGGEEADFGDPGSLFAPQEEISLDDLADAKALTCLLYTSCSIPNLLRRFPKRINGYFHKGNGIWLFR